MEITVASSQALGGEFSNHTPLYTDSRNSMPVGGKGEGIILWTPSGLGHMLWQRYNAVLSYSMLNSALYGSASIVFKGLYEGSQLSEQKRAVESDAIELAMSRRLTACRRYACSLFHTTSKRVDLERLETGAFHDMRLASRTISWAKARMCLKEIKFANLGWDLKYLRTRLQERLASWHSAVHHVAGRMVYNVNVLV